MTMTFDVRDATRNLLQSELVPPALPTDSPVFYVYPEDDESGIEITSFPTIIIQKGLYGDGDVWKRQTQADLRYTYWLEIVAYLGAADLPDWDKARMAEDWQDALRAVILSNPTLDGTIEQIETSDNGETIYTRDGFYDWYTQPNRNATSYWGVGLRMRVTQSVAYAETVGVEDA